MIFILYIRATWYWKKTWQKNAFVLQIYIAIIKKNIGIFTRLEKLYLERILEWLGDFVGELICIDNKN